MGYEHSDGFSGRMTDTTKIRRRRRSLAKFRIPPLCDTQHVEVLM